MQDPHILVDGLGTIPSQSGRLISSDVDEFAEMHRPAWDLEFEQLASGDFFGRKEFRRSADGMVYREQYSRRVRGVGQSAPGTVVIGLVNRVACEQGRWWGRSFPVGRFALVVIPAELGVDLVLPSGSVDLVAVLPKERLRHAIGMLTGTEPHWLRGGNPFLELPKTAHDQLWRSWSGSLRGGEVGGLFEELVVGLASAVSRATVSGKSPRDRGALVRRAVELCRRAEWELSISCLAQELRVSERALHYAFVSHVGLSPSRYLKLHRLNLARRRLREADPKVSSVGEIAGACGFSEAGRFAVEFRELFGEKPSELLRQGG